MADALRREYDDGHKGTLFHPAREQ